MEQIEYQRCKSIYRNERLIYEISHIVCFLSKLFFLLYLKEFADMLKILVVCALVIGLYSVQIVNDLSNDFPETHFDVIQDKTVYLDTLVIRVERKVN